MKDVEDRSFCCLNKLINDASDDKTRLRQPFASSSEHRYSPQKECGMFLALGDHELLLSEEESHPLSQSGRAMEQYFSELLKGWQELCQVDVNFSTFSDSFVTKIATKGNTNILKDKSNSLFSFDPLDATEGYVRVIKVLPTADRGDIIRCELEVVPLGNDYIALSYVWGSDLPSRVIELNGKTFFVRRNLEAFLRYVRQYLPRAILFIDVIPIKQNDINERNHQVRQMTRIFESARLVLMWLGRDMCLTMDLLASYRPYQQGEPLRPTRWTCFPERWSEVLDELFEAEYWSRLWIVLEIWAARKLRIACVGGFISWECFVLFVQEVYNTEEGHSWKDSEGDYSKNGRLTTFMELRNPYYSPGKNLEELLKACGENTCSDLRDRVFVLTNMSRFYHRIHIDYRMTRLELFRSILGDSQGDFLYRENFEKQRLALLLMKALDIKPADYLGLDLNAILSSHCKHFRLPEEYPHSQPPSKKPELERRALLHCFLSNHEFSSWDTPPPPVCASIERVSQYPRLRHCAATYLPATRYVKDWLFSSRTHTHLFSFLPCAPEGLPVDPNIYCCKTVVLKDILDHWVYYEGLVSWNVWVLIAKTSLHRFFGKHTVYLNWSAYDGEDDRKGNGTSTAIEDYLVEELYHDLVLEDSRRILYHHPGSHDLKLESEVSYNKHSKAPRHQILRLCRSLRGFQNIRSRVQYIVCQSTYSVLSGVTQSARLFTV